MRAARTANRQHEPRLSIATTREALAPSRDASTPARIPTPSRSRPTSRMGYETFTPSRSRATSPGRETIIETNERTRGAFKCPECGFKQSESTASDSTDELVGRLMSMLLSHTIWYFAHLICIIVHSGVLIWCLIIEVTLPSKDGCPKILIGAFIVAAAGFTSNIFAFLHLARTLPQKELRNNVWLLKKTIFMMAWLQKAVLIVVDFCVLAELLNPDFIEDDKEALLRTNPRFFFLAVLFIVAGSTAIACFVLDLLSFMHSYSTHRRIFGEEDFRWQHWFDA